MQEEKTIERREGREAQRKELAQRSEKEMGMWVEDHRCMQRSLGTPQGILRSRILELCSRDEDGLVFPIWKREEERQWVEG